MYKPRKQMTTCEFAACQREDLVYITFYIYIYSYMSKHLTCAVSQCTKNPTIIFVSYSATQCSLGNNVDKGLNNTRFKPKKKSYSALKTSLQTAIISSVTYSAFSHSFQVNTDLPFPTLLEKNVQSRSLDDSGKPLKSLYKTISQ